MYYKIDDFVKNCTYEMQSTIKLWKNLTDQSLSFKPHPDVRSLGFMAWHITVTFTEMMGLTGLKVDGTHQADYNGESVTTILETYERSATSLMNLLQSQWKDADLDIEDDMYGQRWKRGNTLQILLRHQTHHRGEMIPLMRMAGLKVIGIYGPSKEEWIAWGREPMN
ncbi:MAG: DinB family protein [Bacteroidetes bacterium]|nr:DinB family protein [Bacteroidota bacterium]